MAGLVSPKPISYMQHTLQYNPYQQQRGISYSESPSNAAGVVQAQLAAANAAAAAAVFGGSGGGSPAGNVPMHDEQKIYALVIDLLNPGTREAALLELSKKREQYDDLALVLWHSFGTYLQYSRVIPVLTYRRYHAGPAAGNCLRLPAALPAKPHRAYIQSSLQRACIAAMRRVSSRH